MIKKRVAKIMVHNLATFNLESKCYTGMLVYNRKVVLDNPALVGAGVQHRRPGHVSGSWIMAQADVTFQFEIINLELISFLNPIISVIYARFAQYASFALLPFWQKYIVAPRSTDIGNLILYIPFCFNVYRLFRNCSMQTADDWLTKFVFNT